jgi:DNA-binding response OmpR family regulator
MKILLVEDSELDRRILARAIRRLNHEVVEAAHGEGALTALMDKSIRIVISDWQVPEPDGLELCRHVRSDVARAYTYFILITGAEETEARHQAAAEAGVDDFLSKPINEMELWRRLRVAARMINYMIEVQQLESFLPICSYCKSIRDDKNYWNQIEDYINSRTGTNFSHSICPPCMAKHWPGAVPARVCQAVPK